MSASGKGRALYNCGQLRLIEPVYHSIMTTLGLQGVWYTESSSFPVDNNLLHNDIHCLYMASFGGLVN